MTSLIDEPMLDAIRLLADAVRRERVPGIVEFQLLERALDEVARTPHDFLLSHAAAAFRALDLDHRSRVMERAVSMARQVADLRRAAALSAVLNQAAAPAVAAESKAKAKAASPFLAALNRGQS